MPSPQPRSPRSPRLAPTGPLFHGPRRAGALTHPRRVARPDPGSPRRSDRCGGREGARSSHAGLAARLSASGRAGKQCRRLPGPPPAPPEPARPASALGEAARPPPARPPRPPPAARGPRPAPPPLAARNRSEPGAQPGGRAALRPRAGGPAQLACPGLSVPARAGSRGRARPGRGPAQPFLSEPGAFAACGPPPARKDQGPLKSTAEIWGRGPHLVREEPLRKFEELERNLCASHPTCALRVFKVLR